MNQSFTIASLAFLIFGVAHAGTDPIAKNADGSFAVMNQDAAIQYCRNLNMHLPTAREWADKSKSLGTQKIIETPRPNTASGDPETRQEIYWVMEGDGIAAGSPRGYYPIYKQLGTSTKFAVDFYYNSKGYQRTAGLTGRYYFWTSSFTPPTSSNLAKEGYVFDGSSGNILNPSQDGAAVLCF
jgi:hypothetical protein